MSKCPASGTTTICLLPGTASKTSVEAGLDHAFSPVTTR